MKVIADHGFGANSSRLVSKLSDHFAPLSIATLRKPSEKTKSPPENLARSAASGYKDCRNN
jgi:hypothetical protein